MEWVVELVPKDYQLWSLAENIAPSQTFLKFSSNIKEMERLKKESILVYHKKYQSFRIKKLKAVFFEDKKNDVQKKQTKNKLVETEVNVCDITFKNRLHKMGLTQIKAS